MNVTLKNVAPLDYVDAIRLARRYTHQFMRGREPGVRNGVVFGGSTVSYLVYHTKAGNIVVQELKK